MYKFTDMRSKSLESAKFKVTNINDLEILYSVLRETYPNNKIEILTQENFSNGVFESSFTNSHYYYQVDVLP